MGPLRGMATCADPPGSLRLLPHDQDTGGFYVCVIERAAASEATESTDAAVAQKRAVSPSAPEGPEQAAKKAKVEEAAPGDAAMVEAPRKATAHAEGKKKKKGTDHIFKEDPFFYVKSDDPELLSCM